MIKEKLAAVVIHFQPLERYPPVMNFINYIGSCSRDRFIIFSTKNRATSLKTYVSPRAGIKTRRSSAINPASPFRLISYVLFYAKTLLCLIVKRPAVVIYFETISSWPALIYKKWRGNKVQLFAHYHEYVSPEEYQGHMRLVKQMHQLESVMYKTAFAWISQTNAQRLKAFQEDQPPGKLPQKMLQVMPNYPPRIWSVMNVESAVPDKLRLVYVGSLGYDTMYLQEITDWVQANNSQLSLDIYAYNIDQNAMSLLRSLNCENIKFQGECDYHELPVILKQYDVGLVIYKPYSYNMVHSVPNKVFEYLACGLDVWFAHNMVGTLPYTRESVYPKVIPVDFNQLDMFDFRAAVSREGISFEAPEFYSEKVYDVLLKKIKSYAK